MHQSLPPLLQLCMLDATTLSIAACVTSGASSRGPYAGCSQPCVARSRSQHQALAVV